MTRDDQDAGFRAAQQLRSLKQAAAYLNVSDSTIRRMVRRGALTARRVGGQYRFAQHDLEAAAGYAAPPHEDSFVVPDWATERVARWKARLSSLIPYDPRVQAIVVDRRGSKVFEVIRPLGFRWGDNLWHSDGLDMLTDDELKVMFAGSLVVIFDEMVQQGRDLYRLKRRFADIGIEAQSVCLVRRRSAFLNGRLRDPEVRAVEDLDDEAFTEAAAFLSRLFDYCHPPLDPDHVIVTGRSMNAELADNALALLGDLGVAGVVWNKFSRQDSNIAAFALDRPYFFDVRQCGLPAGMEARWEGPCKIRPYISYTQRRITCVFICYPSLSAPIEVWKKLIPDTNARPGVQGRIATADQIEKAHLIRAYLNICTDISVQLLRQAVNAGMFERLGITNLEPYDINQLAAFFGWPRARQLSLGIKSALQTRTELPATPLETVPICVDPYRRIAITTDPASVRKAILGKLPHRNPSSAADESSAIEYESLVLQTRPIDESAVSIALDRVVDGVDARPTELVRSEGEGVIRVSRAYQSSEYDDDSLAAGAVHKYDAMRIRHTMEVGVLALDRWLTLCGKHDETELIVAKLLVNLAHDWGNGLPPLAIRPYANKHGYMPALEVDVPYLAAEPRYLVRELVDAGLFHEERRNGHNYYRPQVGRGRSDTETFALSGHERAHVNGLVRTYAAIQGNIRIERAQSYRGPQVGTYSDALVVLSSARNEHITFSTGLFQVGNWIKIGQKLFWLLQTIDGSIDPALRGSLQKDSSDLAQAARFLQIKLSMYESVPVFRTNLVHLIKSHALDHGEILLDTVDREARFATDYATSSYPVGLLKRAWSVMQPFTSLLRQALTEVGLETDRRRPQDRVVTNESNEVIVKDVVYYAAELERALESWSIPPSARLIPEEIAAAHPSRDFTVSRVYKLSLVFEAIVEELHASLHDDLGRSRAREREDRRRAELIRLALEFELNNQIAHHGFLAVGDLETFAGVITQLSTLADRPEMSIRPRIRDWLKNQIPDLSENYPRTFWRLTDESCVVAGSDPNEIISSIVSLNQMLHRTIVFWCDQKAEHFDWMRFGVTAVGNNISSSIIEAYSLSSLPGVPRGTIAISADVYSRLSSSTQSDFIAQSPVGHDRELWVWSSLLVSLGEGDGFCDE